MFLRLIDKRSQLLVLFNLIPIMMFCKGKGFAFILYKPQSSSPFLFVNDDYMG